MKSTAAPLIPENPTLSNSCRPWLDAEISVVKPQVVVCLGATASQSLLGKEFRVTQHRGELIRSELAPFIVATVPPSSILRAPDDAQRHAEYGLFVDDLKAIASVLRIPRKAA